MNYKLPDSLTKDINKFATLATGFQNNSVSTTEFKAFRVPMGVYEQRKNGIYMARVRATGGFITPRQLLGMIDIALRNGSDLLHITTRAEVQILNLELSSVEHVLKELQDIGLATKGGGGNTVRNILVSEYSGLGREEVFDTTPYAMALTNAVVPEADSYLMPRKLKIAFSSDENYVDYAGINDIGLIAQLKDEKRGFKVYLGGGAGSKPSVGWLYKEFLPAEELYALVKGVKDFFNAYGNRKDKYKARIRFLFYKWGKEETFRLIDQYVEEAKKTGITLEVNEKAYLSASRNLLVDKGEKMPSCAGRELVSTVLPFTWGNVWLRSSDEVNRLKAILEFVSNIGDHTIRFTPKQNIRFRNIPASVFSELETLLKDYSAAYDKPAVLNNIVSCTGADTCRLGICLSKGLATVIYKAIEQHDIDLDLLSDARINVAGCPNLCGQPLWADLGFVGKVLHTDHAYPAYQVFIGANYIDIPQLAQSIGSIPAYNIPKFVVDLVNRFADTVEIAESLGHKINLGQWLRSHAGHKTAVALVDKYAQVPLFAEDKNYYFDWGSDDVFQITKRGKPECSAGLFDMISVDQQAIADARKKVEKGDARSVYDIIFHASRMLLVTRGLDPQDAAGVFDDFIEHFIHGGYVDTEYIQLLQHAKADGADGVYDLHQANTFADAVITLYEGMDDALQFKKSTDKVVKEDVKEKPNSGVTTELPQKGEGAGHPQRTKDLRGILCPMNFVRTKLELAMLQSGDLLEILLDDGKPIENVPASIRLEGHQILSQLQLPEGHWTVLIKKK